MPNNDTLQAFIDNPENTMNRFASASIAAFLMRLSEEYFDIQKKTIDECIGTFQNLVTNNIHFLGIDATQFQTVTTYLQGVFNQPPNQLDAVTVSTERGVIRKAFPLKEVFALVCAATMDINVYHIKYPQKTPLQLEEDKQQRVRVLCNSLVDLVRDTKCHQGIRHELVGTLNMVYPGAHFIEDVDAFFTDIVVQCYLEELKKLPMELQFQLYSAWAAGDEADSNLRGFFVTHNENAKMKLVAVCKEHYINLNDTAVTAKISNTINIGMLIYLPVPLDFHSPQSKYVHSILITQPDANNARNQALKIAQTDLQNPGLTFTNISQKIPHFYKVEKIYQRCRKVRYMLWGNVEAQNLLQSMQQSCDDYFQNFPGMTDDESAQQLTSLASSKVQLKAHLGTLEQDFDFVTNFFLHFTNFLNENKPEQKAPMYMRLRAQREIIILPDGVIQTQPISSDGIMDIEPYLIAQTLAHALLVSPAHWSIAFYNLFSRVIGFIESNLNLPDSDPRHRGYAYYQTYLPEFKLLQTLCLRAHAGDWGNASAAFPANPTVLIFPNLTDLQGEAVCGEYSQNILLSQKVQEMPDDILKAILYRCANFFATRHLFFTIFWNIPVTKQRAFSNSLGPEFLRGIIHDDYELADVLGALPAARQLAFLNALGPEFLRGIIQDGMQLGRVLKVLPEENQLAFLNSLGGIEFLRGIIHNGDQLARVLDGVPEANRLIFLNSFSNEFLQRIIYNDYELAEVLRPLPAVSQLAFLDSLGTEFLQGIIQNDKRFRRGVILSRVLEQLPEANRLIFLNSFSNEFLQRIIYNDYELAEVLSKLPAVSQLAFLDSLGTEFLRGVIKNGSELADVLRALPAASQLAFLYALDAGFLQKIIQDYDGLRKFLERLPRTNWLVFLNLVGTKFLQGIIQNAYQFKFVLDRLPKEKSQEFLNLLGFTEFLVKISKDIHQLYCILDLVGTENESRLIFLSKLGAKSLQDIIQDVSQLGIVLDKLPEKNRQEFLNLLGARFLQGIIQNDDQSISVLNRLPTANQQEFLNLLNSSTCIII